MITLEAIKNHGLDNLENIQPDSVYGCDLHNELYNMDYFVIGSSNAEKYLNEYGVFKAIGEIKEYEEFNFGETNTDFSDSEKVCNMLSYIKGEEFLNKSEILKDNWDNLLTKKQLKKIYKELKNENI